MILTLEFLNETRIDTANNLLKALFKNYKIHSWRYVNKYELEIHCEDNDGCSLYDIFKLLSLHLAIKHIKTEATQYNFVSKKEKIEEIVDREAKESIEDFIMHKCKCTGIPAKEFIYINGKALKKVDRLFGTMGWYGEYKGRSAMIGSYHNGATLYVHENGVWFKCISVHNRKQREEDYIIENYINKNGKEEFLRKEIKKVVKRWKDRGFTEESNFANDLEKECFVDSIVDSIKHLFMDGNQ